MKTLLIGAAAWVALSALILAGEPPHPAFEVADIQFHTDKGHPLTRSFCPADWWISATSI
jgi:hypothetical protein